MARPFVLGVDLDGTVADYTGGFRDFVIRQFDHLACLPSPPDPDHWDFHKATGWQSHIGSRDEFMRLHTKAVQEGLFLGLIPYDNAVSRLVRLSEIDGVHIRIITHRLLGDSRLKTTAVSDTLQWLHDYGIPSDDVCFVSDKTAVGCDLLIDDSPSHLAAYRAAGRKFVTYHQLYNRDVVGLRAHNWDEVYDIVQLESNHER